MEHYFLLEKRILAFLEEAKLLQAKIQEDWAFADNIYRFYNQSYKVYYAQTNTKECFEFFQKVAGEEFVINDFYLQIFKDGTDKSFSLDDNKNWVASTRTVIEALLHTKTILDTFVECGDKILAGLDAEKSSNEGFQISFATLTVFFCKKR